MQLTGLTVLASVSGHTRAGIVIYKVHTSASILAWERGALIDV